MNPFPANLQNMRTRIGYTQEELGAATGIPRINSLPTNARAALSMYLDYLVERCERTK